MLTDAVMLSQPWFTTACVVYHMLCRVVPCPAVPCAVPCRAVLCCAVSCRAVPCCAGALAEAVAHSQDPAASRVKHNTSGKQQPSQSPCNRLSSGSYAPDTPLMTGQPTTGSDTFTWTRQSSGLRRQYSTSGGGTSSSLLGGNHSATAAARMAREASLKSAHNDHGSAAVALDSDRSAARLDAVLSGNASEASLQQQQLQCDEQHALAMQYAAASVQLASALATARQVLSDLILGSEPTDGHRSDLEAEMADLTLEEALSEVVYQVQEKLSAAAAAAEVATEQAAAAVAQSEAMAAAAATAAAAAQQTPSLFAEGSVAHQVGVMWRHGPASYSSVCCVQPGSAVVFCHAAAGFRTLSWRCDRLFSSAWSGCGPAVSAGTPPRSIPVRVVSTDCSTRGGDHLLA